MGLPNLKLVVSEGARRLDRLFPGYFPNAKHNHYADFGFPTTLSFSQLYSTYCRNGLAKAAVAKTVAKTWQDAPCLLDHERDGSYSGTDDSETTVERQVREHFAKLRLWQRLAEADRRGLVGCYAGLILRLADGKAFDQPVTGAVPGGLEGLVEVIPAWEGQLAVSKWDDNVTSPTYGLPVMYRFNEADVANNSKQQRQFEVHPDRVVVWSADGTLNGKSFLEAGYNDLMTMEKIIGAGGEGFWKNAKSAPVFEIDKEVSVDQMAKAMGVDPSVVVDKMNVQVEDFQKGFDKMLMLQGMAAKQLNVLLPSPEHFFDIALQSFAASIQCPTKILVGMQTGERASSEDAQEWAETNMARRTDTVIPNISLLVERLKRFNVLADKPWTVDWTDLTETSMSDKIERADKMADVNQKMKDTGEFVFTPEEIRAAVDLEPLSDGDKLRETDTPDDENAAVTPPAGSQPPKPTEQVDA